MTDIVVVGGGIVGASVCFYASQMGASCTLIERDGVGFHASGFAFGGLHPRVVSTSESEMPQFAIESFEEHRRLHEELESIRIHSSTWRRRSSISLAWNETDANLFHVHAKRNSSSRWIDADRLHDLEPRISNDALGGLLTTDSAEIDSAVLTDSLFRIAAPALILDEVVGVECTNSRVESIQTRGGKVVTADAFVFSMGPWANLAFDWFDLNGAVRPLKGQILRLQTNSPAFEYSFSINGNYMSTKSDGLLWVGTTEEDARFDESPTDEGRREIIGVLQRIVPESMDFAVIKQTACLRPVTPDGELIMGRVPSMSNAFIGTGGGRKGILYGPLMGKYLASQALETNKISRWFSFSLDRFAKTS